MSRHSVMRKLKSAPSSDDGSAKKGYRIFLLNFHGDDYIGPIRREFVKNVLSGLRRNFFIIDYDQILGSLQENLETSVEISEDKDSSCEPVSQSLNDLTKDSLGTVANAILRCQKKYDEIEKLLAKQKAFDTLDYWLGSLKNPRSSDLKGTRNLDGKSRLSQSSRAGNVSRKSKRKSAVESSFIDNPSAYCYPLKPMPHNKVGNNTPDLVNRHYIEDEPEGSPFDIVVMGHFDNKIAANLMSHGEPVQGIINLLPGSSNYEQLVPNPKKDHLVALILQAIQKDVYHLRQRPVTKPIGVFQYRLPIISKCHAELRSRQIYDQLSWLLYDIESLRRDYEKFYLRPFQEVNVALQASRESQEMKYLPETLQLDGHYLMQPLPASSSDLASMALYLDMLLNTIGQPENILNELEVLLISVSPTPLIFAVYGKTIKRLTHAYASAFQSITKLPTNERVFLEATNKMLCNLVEYADLKKYRSISMSCLDYQLLRPYFLKRQYKSSDVVKFYEKAKGEAAIHLPPYGQLYATDDGVVQRLQELHDRFDDVEVTEIHPKHFLYHFKRKHNEIIQENQLMVIPTRLCFRDFTIFQMPQFLEELQKAQGQDPTITPLDDIASEHVSRRVSELTNYDYNMFLRPLSLQLRKIKYLQQIEPNVFPDNASMYSRKSRKSKKSRYSTAGSMNAESVDSLDFEEGLPVNHALLKGYNLEDIRQEIWLKTSKYFFEEGHLYLFEQRHCFEDTNEHLECTLNGNTLSVRSKNIPQPACSAEGVRLTTANGIVINLDSNMKAANKIVINYPNGLTVKHFSDHAEQLWHRENTVNDEKKRIFTPFGAVIVSYQNDEVITILRYNGEVYDLYQYEPCGREFEEAENEESTRSSEQMVESFLDDNEENDELKTMIPAGGKDASSSQYRQIRRQPICRPAKAPSSVPKTSVDTELSAGGDNLLSDRKLDLTLNVATCKSPTEGTSQFQRTSAYLSRELISDQLHFLEKICSAYNLSYIHLTLTTSTGRVFNLTEAGTLLEDIPYDLMEWHDYYRNKSFASRGDNVKMIWSADTLRCVHADGSVFVTRTAELLQEIDDLIGEPETGGNYRSFQHSYEDAEDEDESKRGTGLTNIYVNVYGDSALPTLEVPTTQSPSLQSVFDNVEVEGEETFRQPEGYVCFSCDDLSFQHKQYAGIHLTQTRVNLQDPNVNVRIKAVDDIQVQVLNESVINLNVWYGLGTNDFDQQEVNCLKNMKQSFIGRPTEPHMIRVRSAPEAEHDLTSFAEEVTGFDDETSFSQAAHLVELQQSDESKAEFRLKTILRVQVGSDFQLQLSYEDCTVKSPLERCSHGDGQKVRENVSFKFSHKETMRHIFSRFIEQIASFKKYTAPKTDEVLFLERQLDSCESRGLEFFNAMPDISDGYNKCGNTTIHLKNFQSVNKKMTHDIPGLEEDLKSFPRFKSEVAKDTSLFADFPMVLSASFYLKVPAQMRCSDEVHKFMGPLDVIDFKKMRRYIRSAVNEHAQKQLKDEIVRSASAIAWESKHAEFARRLLVEKQRMGLYQAILRHKTYPKYHKWIQEYSGRAACIDLFDFMREQCAPANKPGTRSSSRGKACKKQKKIEVVEEFA